MNRFTILKNISNPGLHNITEDVECQLKNLFDGNNLNSCGILHLFNMHTSCALVINESWDDSAKRDLESFYNHLAPRNLNFIEHHIEGEDDSPAHMKSSLLQQNVALIVENKKLILGQWQGIFLAEFRDHAHKRTILGKYQPDL